MNEFENYYALPAIIAEEFKLIEENLFQLWSERPDNLNQLLDSTFEQTMMLMLKMSAEQVNQGDTSAMEKGEVGFRREVSTSIMNGLLGIFSQLQQFKTGDDLNLSLREF